ncbi:MAG: cation diffusion facilitator family transporter [Candidatus Omnitrophica bacterium]|jgi:cation diffusion facilitator family transporter|nr:cation diffusion facilitator family transporter [Candidatus Omnitrophota bacterium]
MTKQKDQFLAARISILGALILFIISAVVGIAVDSITLILDASASLVILATGFLMRFSIKKVHAPPDDLYNFGYHKYESLTVVIQNVLIVATCAISIKFAIQDIVHADDVHSYSLPAIATFFSGVLGIFILFYLKVIARKTDSQMIRAASLHWLSDTVLSFGICVGFLFGMFMQNMGYARILPYIDPVMSILLALFFILFTLKAGTYDLFELLDAAPRESIRGKIKTVIDLYRPKSFGVHRLRARKAGKKIFIDVCFLVRDNLTINQIEELAESFERDLKTHLPDSDVVVYFKSRQPKGSDEK